MVAQWVTAILEVAPTELVALWPMDCGCVAPELTELCTGGKTLVCIAVATSEELDSNMEKS